MQKMFWCGRSRRRKKKKRERQREKRRKRKNIHSINQFIFPRRLSNLEFSCREHRFVFPGNLIMAVDNDLVSVRPTRSLSSAASSYPPHNIQVATSNSATFIRFPTSARTTQPFIPLCPSRTSFSSTPVSSMTVDSKSSYSPEPIEVRRGRSEQRVNPILNNPLLNHRREKPQIHPRPCFSSQPTSRIPATTVTTIPIVADVEETVLPIETPLAQIQDENTNYMDEVKFDYISRWIQEVRAATKTESSSPTRIRRTKRRTILS